MNVDFKSMNNHLPKCSTFDSAAKIREGNVNLTPGKFTPYQYHGKLVWDVAIAKGPLEITHK